MINQLGRRGEFFKVEREFPPFRSTVVAEWVLALLNWCHMIQAVTLRFQPQIEETTSFKTAPSRKRSNVPLKRWHFSNSADPSALKRVVKCLFILLCNTKTIQVVAVRLGECVEWRRGFKMRPSRSRCRVPVKRWNSSNSAVSAPIEGEEADEPARRWHRTRPDVRQIPSPDTCSIRPALFGSFGHLSATIGWPPRPCRFAASARRRPNDQKSSHGAVLSPPQQTQIPNQFPMIWLSAANEMGATPTPPDASLMSRRNFISNQLKIRQNLKFSFEWKCKNFAPGRSSHVKMSTRAQPVRCPTHATLGRFKRFDASPSTNLKQDEIVQHLRRHLFQLINPFPRFEFPAKTN